ncbi:MAG: hypothetical protein ACRDZ8_11475 [Acidimicrobiales bacterium]
MSADVTCPTCGTVTELADINRDAGAFCRVCDYPLFWIRNTAMGVAGGSLADEVGMRRYPGTAGLVTIATIECWNCEEHNPVTNVNCLRCGELLHPAPPPYVPPPAAPPVVYLQAPAPLAPPPPPRPFQITDWIAAIVACLILAGWCGYGLWRYHVL